MTDFAFAYWVDDTVNGKRVQGVCVGVPDVETSEVHEGVISPGTARRLAAQLLSVADKVEGK